MVYPSHRLRMAMRIATALVAGVLLIGCARSKSPAPSRAPAETAARSYDVFVRVPPAEAASLAAFEPDLPAVEGSFECGRREVMSPNMTMVSASFPTRAEAKATVVVFIDSTGKIIRYAERRGPPIRPAVAPGQESRATPAEVAAAAAAVRSTMISLDYGQGRASVSNRGGGRPDQSMSGAIDVVASMPKFGKPLERAARVQAQCAIGR